MITLDLHVWMFVPAAWLAGSAYCAFIDGINVDALQLFALLAAIPASMLLTRFLP